jgi:uncharacterized membrane protein YdbT with pleckstrin-like domain
MSNYTIAQFLKTLDIFADLEDDELLDLAKIVDEYEFESQAVIAYQRDVADRLYIVESGRLFASQMDNQGVVRNSQSFFAGDYFDDVWLFAIRAHDSTVRGAEDGRLYVIEQDKFLQFLIDYPYLTDYLSLSDEAKAIAETTSVKQPRRRTAELNLLPDEHVRYMKRRTVWLLLLELALPFLLFFGWVFVVLYFFSLSTTLTAIILGLPALLLAALTIWRTLDWANDYFVITDKHLIHHEYSLRGFQININKIPVDQIQSVEIEKPSLLATILNTGSARITTSAQSGAIRFDYIDNPKSVSDTLNELGEQSKAVDAGQNQMDMREALEAHFEADPAYRRLEQESDGDGEDEEEWEYEPLGPLDYLVESLSIIGRRISNIFRTRSIDGNIITYHKHPFTLIGKTWLIMLISLGLFVGAIWVQSTTIKLILAGLWFITLLVFIWFFLDWRNDIYQVTDRFVFDIDRLPLGFGQSKKQADLSNIQNVNAEKPGLLATIFNFGYVSIETAGASPDIVFEKISNPGRAQSDIFQRRDELKRKQEVGRMHGQRKEIAVMLDVFHQAQQAGRIPDRIPTEEPEE